MDNGTRDASTNGATAGMANLTASALARDGAGGPSSEPLLQVGDLRKYFPITRGLFRKQIGEVRAVDGLSFSINHV
jgi:ABC-type glutathione transport system ATPase component